VIRICKTCGRKNRIPAAHLADTGRCGACKAPLPPVDEPLEVDGESLDEIVQNARVPDACGLLREAQRRRTDVETTPNR
jgi:thioredoxin 2